MNDPILVTGPDRSGTTLLFALLASHPRIAMTRRTNLWRWFYGRFGDLADPDNLERALAVMLRYHRLAQLDPEPDRIRREFAGGEPSYGRLFGLLHQHHAERAGKPRWGDKSLHTEHFADEILADYPQARIIHLLRDPRDRHASVTRRYTGRRKGIGAVTGRWLLSTRRGRRNLRTHPGNYLLVRYEDLARSPVETLEEVCRFIGEQYDPSMLAMQGAPDHGDEGNSSFERIEPGVISTRSIGRFRTVLSPREVASIQALTRSHMTAHGYLPEPVPMEPSERIRFWLGQFPHDTLRVGGWLATAGRKERAGGDIPPERLLEQPVSALNQPEGS